MDKIITINLNPIKEKLDKWQIRFFRFLRNLFPLKCPHCNSKMDCRFWNMYYSGWHCLECKNTWVKRKKDGKIVKLSDD